jgi:hypothetical protein
MVIERKSLAHSLGTLRSAVGIPTAFVDTSQTKKPRLHEPELTNKSVTRVSVGHSNRTSKLRQVLDGLLSLQHVDGHWDLDTKFINTVQLSLGILIASRKINSIEMVMPFIEKFEANVLATIIALCLFQLESSEIVEIYEYVLNKSKDWLANQRGDYTMLQTELQNFVKQLNIV